MSKKFTRSIEPSDDLAHACQRFLAAVQYWAYEAIDRYAAAPATDVHDQGTYTSGWEPLVRASGDERILHFLQQTRDLIRDHFVRTDQWRHGYWRMNEAHHGTEHYELFLGALQRLLPEDRETSRQLDDMAEHIGNWSTDVPAWFDWDKRRFYSLFFGADGLGTETGMAINSPDHLRCVNLCLLAAHGNPEKRQRYMELALLYAGEWADAILERADLPVALTPNSILYQFSGDDERIYRSFMGQAPDLQTEVDRAENFLGSDAINTFLHLWQETAERRFRQAAERLLAPLVTQLTDADAGAVADAVRAYRNRTGSTRYDAALLASVDALDPFAIRELTLDTGQASYAVFGSEEHPSQRRASGVGKRADAPRWLEDGAERQHNPITLAVAAEIRGDHALHTRAIDLAHTYFLLAREAFPDGRHHGCSARTVSAIARGHGRENHAGMTTAVLGPALVQQQ